MCDFCHGIIGHSNIAIADLAMFHSMGLPGMTGPPNFALRCYQGKYGPMLRANITLRRSLQNHGNIATKGSPKSDYTLLL